MKTSCLTPIDPKSQLKSSIETLYQVFTQERGRKQDLERILSLRTGRTPPTSAVDGREDEEEPPPLTTTLFGAIDRKLRQEFEEN